MIYNSLLHNNSNLLLLHLVNPQKHKLNLKVMKQKYTHRVNYLVKILTLQVFYGCNILSPNSVRHFASTNFIKATPLKYLSCRERTSFWFWFKFDLKQQKFWLSHMEICSQCNLTAVSQDQILFSYFCIQWGARSVPPTRMRQQSSNTKRVDNLLMRSSLKAI